MNKSELKEVRKELVSMMHILREKQEIRRNKIIEKPGEKHNLEIDKMLMKLMSSNADYYLNAPTQEFIEELYKDIKKIKKNKSK